jgi:hypothetical protein
MSCQDGLLAVVAVVVPVFVSEPLLGQLLFYPRLCNIRIQATAMTAY